MVAYLVYAVLQYSFGSVTFEVISTAWDWVEVEQ